MAFTWFFLLALWILGIFSSFQVIWRVLPVYFKRGSVLNFQELIFVGCYSIIYKFLFQSNWKRKYTSTNFFLVIPLLRFHFYSFVLFLSNWIVSSLHLQLSLPLNDSEKLQGQRLYWDYFCSPILFYNSNLFV